MRSLIYVSGPYTADPERCTDTAMIVADHIIEEGYAVFVPHLSHFMHLKNPRHYEDWMDIDMAVVERCDAVFRIPGESDGADRETEHAEKLGIPVFHTYGHLFSSVPTQQPTEAK